LLGQIGLIVLGRGAFEEMAPAWSTSDSSMARTLNALPKVVFAHGGSAATLDPGEYAFVAAPDGSDGFRATPGAQRHSGEIGTETM
jgi:hypothetical protein